MVQMTIAQDWAACLCGLGCLSRAAGCVGRVGAGLRRRLSSGLVNLDSCVNCVRTSQLTQESN